MNTTDEHESVAPRDLVNRIRCSPGIEGVTLTGGEPFQQPLEALLSLVQQLRRETPLSILCYTGYTWEQLHQGLDAALRQQILQHLDVLIDGPYVRAQNAGHRWRGSANQRFFFLSDRYRRWAREWTRARGRQLEIELQVHGALFLTGIPEEGFWARFSSRLEDYGVAADFAGPRQESANGATEQ